MTIYKVYQIISEVEYWAKYFVNYDKAQDYKRELMADYMSAIAETLVEKAKIQEVDFQKEYSEKLEDIDFEIEEIEVEE